MLRSRRSSKRPSWVEWTDNGDGTVTVAGHVLDEGDYDLALDPADGVVAAPLPGNEAIVVLDTELTGELIAEGRARDLVRSIQNHRKEAGLNVTDRIELTIDGDPVLLGALGPNLDWISEQVLSTHTTLAAPRSGSYTADAVVEGGTLQISLTTV